MNRTLRTNTIARIERHGIDVGDSGGTAKPHYVLGEHLSDDQLYLVANIIDRCAELWKLGGDGE